MSHTPFPHISEFYSFKARHGYKTVVMIGDGATDMEATQVDGGADAFVGFGGIQEREKVRAGADWYVYDFEDMMAALDDRK